MNKAGEYLNYKGKGNHSVNQLEKIIEQREEELHLIRSGESNQERIKENLIEFTFLREGSGLLNSKRDIRKDVNEYLKPKKQ
jgi:hypothetical protein